MFKKVLVANRGEIALRVIRALKEMGIASVAIYSDVDKDSLHRLHADYAYPLDGNRAVDTYMNIEKLLEIAKKAGVDAVHPGYGFFSEKEDYAKAFEDNGIVFIGPKSETIAMMGNKIAARKMMIEAGVPVVPGTEGAIDDSNEAQKIADSIGYPVLIKAAAGGGGVGMKIINSSEEMKDMFERVQSQALSVFGDGSVFIEKYIGDARHIEIQLVADKFGNAVYLGERDCSIQRRHQKIIEEAPSPVITDELRREMGEVAVKIAKAVNYESVGTVEFIYSQGAFYFLEMNTRLQVEHPVTELVTGIDLVKTQIKIAEGEKLSFKQEDISTKGHAIECRICAEDPANGFMPSAAKITDYCVPGGNGIRVDSGVKNNYEITSYYDSMIAKLIVWGEDRETAIRKLKSALSEYIIVGPKTNLSYLSAIVDSKEFSTSEFNTKFVEKNPQFIEISKQIAKNMETKLRDAATEFESLLIELASCECYETHIN